ncbi:MAG: Maltotriose-binding protein, partial [Actinomycetia bacterium]|nr:Maltotriose-binding protein [Actinomycetes bacterium]
GYDPNALFYHGGAGVGTYGPLIGATYFDKAGKSNLARDPGWKTLLTWQKSLIDFYGYDNLVKWQTGAGDEYAASRGSRSSSTSTPT